MKSKFDALIFCGCRYWLTVVMNCFFFQLAVKKINLDKRELVHKICFFLYVLQIIKNKSKRQLFLMESSSCSKQTSVELLSGYFI